MADKPLEAYKTKAERTRTWQGWALIVLNVAVALRVFEIL